MKEHEDLLNYLQNVGVDPSRLIFEDELTRIYNRRFLLNYLQHKIDWDSLDSNPVSLLMMDFDNFKAVNDTHGHDVGDEALVWAARLMQKVSGEDGLAIRYAGDEFMILLPDATKEKAIQMAEALLEGNPDIPTPLEEIGSELAITFSIGVASAPDDVTNSKELIHQADTALYAAKKGGRNQYADAGNLVSQEEFPKATLRRIDQSTISGRASQHEQVAEALAQFNRQHNQFLIIDGDDGMGKSEFLKSVQLSAGEGEFCQIEIKGILQEGFRPYYLCTNILLEMMNQRADKGVGILNELTSKESAYLSTILPQLGEPEESFLQEDPKIQREGLFATLIHLIPQLLDSRPLVLLIDDLHLSDEATLLLLRKLILREDFPIFVCGTASSLQEDQSEGSNIPLRHFLGSHHEELNILKIPLTPLTAHDITLHFQSIFPQVEVPEEIESRLAQLTQGNPLFVGEILRKLVRDEKISLIGQQWVLAPMDDDYLPKSLEEIVSQKVALLDEDSRQLLEQLSTFGEDVSLSMLTGSSEVAESKVLELIDQAAAQGLIRSDYEMNDETIRFLSKGVMNFTYGGIEEGRKQELHERVGTYQENLYAQNLLPSAETLSYHFQLSANQKKAGLYRELTQASNERVFNAAEAVAYSGEKVEDTGPATLKLRILDPLDRTTVTLIPEVIEMIVTTVTEGHKATPEDQASTVKVIKEKLDAILESGDQLHITLSDNALLVNGEPLNATKHGSIVDAFTHLLIRSQLRGIAFFQDLSEQELSAMLKGLRQISGKRIPWGYWQGFTLENDLHHLEFKQMSFSSRAAVADALTQSNPPAFSEAALPEDQPDPQAVVQAEPQPEEEVPEEPPPLPEEPLRVTGTPVAVQTTPDEAPVLKISSKNAPLTDDFLKTAAASLVDLFLRGDEAAVHQMLERLFQRFEVQKASVRGKVVNICKSVLMDSGVISQPKFIDLITSQLLKVLEGEKDAGIIKDMSSSFSSTATQFIRSGEYARAGRILMHLRKHQHPEQTAGHSQADSSPTTLLEKLDPKLERLLVEDLRSPEPARVQEAQQLLAGLGPSVVPLLVEVVKQEDDPRLRQIACQLLADSGKEASRLLKRELVLEGLPEQRIRILEVIDTITHDLKRELTFAIEDKNPRVRRAAFQLVERLEDPRITELLPDYAQHQDSAIALAAIEALAKINPAQAVESLLTLIDSITETDPLIACCRALGKIGDPVGIEPLSKILAPTGFLSFGKTKSPQLRATAAFALSQISDPQVAEVLALHVDDPDRRVRQTARDFVNS
ncbi:MAG: diguanylate cyclase [Acidobacteriota bacterium]